MSTNDGMGTTNDDVKQRLEEEATPVIQVNTRICDILGVCELDEPASGTLRVSSPFHVSIVNGRQGCTVSRTVGWTIGDDSGRLDPEETHVHTMIDEEETLCLYYVNCGPYEDRPEGDPDPTTPRITINLIKSGNL